MNSPTSKDTTCIYFELIFHLSFYFKLLVCLVKAPTQTKLYSLIQFSLTHLFVALSLNSYSWNHAESHHLSAHKLLLSLLAAFTNSSAKHKAMVLMFLKLASLAPVANSNR